MDDFKKLPKMQHFKEGGSVQREVKNFTKRDRKTVDEADTAQDKKIVKKAIGMHDVQQHEEKTDLSGLKKGGRAKKSVGTVKKFCGGGNAYKDGGSVTNVYEAKKSSGDIDNIKKVKDIKPAKAATPSKAATKPNFKGSDVAKEKSKPAGDAVAIKKVPPTGDKKAAAPSGAKGGPNKYKCGGGVKKMADGGGVMDALGAAGTGIRDAVLGTPSQNMIARANEAKYLRAKQLQQAAGKPMGGMEQAAMGLAGLGQQAQPAPTAPMSAPVAQKRGGKAGKC